jgi:hypothetical protein
MSEFEAETYEDEVEDEFEEEDELEPEDERDAYIAELEQALAFQQAVHQEAANLQASYGRPNEEEEFDEEGFEQDFEATLQAVEREQGRALLDGEVQRMWQAANEAVEDPSVETDAQIWAAAKQEAGSLDSSDDVAAYIGERLAVPREREEPSARVVDDDGNERPGYDLDKPNERAEAIDRLMAGEDVAGYDSTYTTVESEE